MKSISFIPRKLILVFVILFSLFYNSTIFSQTPLITPGNPNNFITIWNTENSTSVNFFTGPSSGGNYHVYWEQVSNPSNFGYETMAYDFNLTGLAANTSYRIEIYGSSNFTRIIIPLNEKSKLIEISQWGTTKWENFDNTFSNCSNLDITATDVPDLISSSTDMSCSYMFNDCTSLVGANANWNWNTSKVVDMKYMFSGATYFNGDISQWNTEMVQDMSFLFNGNELFNQNIGNWNTSQVKSMEGTFFNCSSFNQPLNQWDVSNCENMDVMFHHAYSFNQPLNNWNTISLEYMSSMFYYAVSFNQDIGDWDISNLKDITKALSYCGMDCGNYSSTLTGWANNYVVPPNLILNSDNLKYSEFGEEARNLLISNSNWSIHGDESIDDYFSIIGPDELCVGDTVYYDLVPLNNFGNWDSYSTNSSIIGNGVFVGESSGSSWVSVIHPDLGCPITKDINIISVPVISTSVVADNNSPCEGEDVQLTAASVSGVTYLWSGPNGFVSSEQNPLLSNVGLDDSGVYSLVITDEVTGCSSVLGNENDNVTITVNANPVISTSVVADNNSPCEGEDVQLTAASVSGVTYLWSGPNGFVSSEQNPLLSNVGLDDSGVYSLVITDELTGCSSVLGNENDNVTITVNPNPVISSSVVADDISPCEGEDVQLTAASVSGVTYLWSGPNGFVSSEQNPLLSNVGLDDSGVYSLVITDEVTGCSSVLGNENDNVTITVNANPVISTSVVADDNTPCEGEDVQLTAASVSGVTYLWSGPNGFVSSEQNPLLSNVGMDDSGDYSLVITDTVTGCSSIFSDELITSIIVIDNPLLDLNDEYFSCGNGSVVIDFSEFDSIFVSGNYYSNNLETFSFDSNGIYEIIGFLNSCGSTSNKILVNVDFPDFELTSNGMDGLCKGDEFEALFSSSIDFIIEWNGPSNYYSLNEYISINSISDENIGTYSYEVSFTNGCVGNGEIELLPFDMDCFPIPGIITPNNDGLNDFWEIDLLDYYPNNSVMIFNRYGNKIYESSPYINDFDGTPNKGILLDKGEVPNGTYFYLIDLGNGEVKKGTLEIQK